MTPAGETAGSGWGRGRTWGGAGDARVDGHKASGVPDVRSSSRTPSCAPRGSTPWLLARHTLGPRWQAAVRRPVVPVYADGQASKRVGADGETEVVTPAPTPGGGATRGRARHTAPHGPPGRPRLTVVDQHVQRHRLRLELVDEFPDGHHGCQVAG